MLLSRAAGLPQKQRERFPALQEVGDRPAEARIRLHELVRQLLGELLLKLFHHGSAVGLDGSAGARRVTSSALWLQHHSYRLRPAFRGRSGTPQESSPRRSQSTAWHARCSLPGSPRNPSADCGRGRHTSGSRAKSQVLWSDKQRPGARSASSATTPSATTRRPARRSASRHRSSTSTSSSRSRRRSTTTAGTSGCPSASGASERVSCTML